VIYADKQDSDASAARDSDVSAESLHKLQKLKNLTLTAKIKSART